MCFLYVLFAVMGYIVYVVTGAIILYVYAEYNKLEDEQLNSPGSIFAVLFWPIIVIILLVQFLIRYLK